MAILNGYLLPTTCLMVPNEDDQKSKVGIINVFMKYLQNISEIRKLVDEVEKIELNNEDFTYREVNFMYVETSTFKRKSE